MDFSKAQTIISQSSLPHEWDMHRMAGGLWNVEVRNTKPTWIEIFASLNPNYFYDVITVPIDDTLEAVGHTCGSPCMQTLLPHETI